MTKTPLSSLSAIPLKGQAARPEVVPAALPAPPPAVAAPLGQSTQGGARSALTVRITMDVQERLREMAHHTRRQKQDLVEEALDRLLREHGF